jgi:hypothetical protein
MPDSSRKASIRVGNARRHSEERDEINRMVDIHRDPLMPNENRFDPAASRRIEMGVEAVSPKRSGTASGAEHCTVHGPEREAIGICSR